MGLKKKHYGELQQNVELKEKFLRNMDEIDKNSEGYIKNVRVILRRFGESEKELNKDLYDFSFSELDDACMNLQCGTWGEVRRIATTLKNYLLFARGKNLGNMSLNITEFFEGNSLKKYVWKNIQEGKIINEDQLKDIVSKIDNPRDKLATGLLFLGIMGKNFDEIRLLKKQDVDTNKKFIVTNEKTIENIPDEVLNLIEEVNETNEYYSINFNKEGDRIERVISLKQNEYLLRPLDARKNVYSEEYMTASAFRQLFSLLKKHFIDDYPYISARNIYISGMLCSFDKYVKENNLEVIDENQGRDIFLQFREEHYPDAPPSSYYDFLNNYVSIIDTDDNVDN